eukprot:337301_1
MGCNATTYLPMFHGSVVDFDMSNYFMDAQEVTGKGGKHGLTDMVITECEWTQWRISFMYRVGVDEVIQAAKNHFLKCMHAFHHKLIINKKRFINCANTQ